MDSVCLHGRALHSGVEASLRMTRSDGPVCFETAHGPVTRAALTVVGTERAVKVAAPGLDVDLVEHLFAALGGLGVQRGIAIAVTGPELPLLDGAAAEYATALSTLRAPRDSPKLRVLRRGQVAIGSSVYEFSPHDHVSMEVHVEFSGWPAESAAWDGTSQHFTENIATARTFGFRAEALELARSGRARFIDPEAVLILENDWRSQTCRPRPRDNELARHKLLDLIGDTYLFGGPPLGRLRAIRPGHTATHHALQVALADGILRRDSEWA